MSNCPHCGKFINALAWAKVWFDQIVSSGVRPGSPADKFNKAFEDCFAKTRRGSGNARGGKDQGKKQKVN